MSRPAINMKSCRICLSTDKSMCPLFKYKLSGNYAEMLTSIADVKVSSDDGLPDKICNRCCTILERAHILKTLAEKTDRRLRRILASKVKKTPTKKIVFDSFSDVKTEIAPLTVKNEPIWEVDIDVNPNKPIETMDGKGLVIANTVIKKLESSDKLEDDKLKKEEVDLTSLKEDQSTEAEFLDDDIFQDDVDDEDYVPPTEIKKTKFKKPNLSEIKVLKRNEKCVVRKVKVIKSNKEPKVIRTVGSVSGNMITCYPIMKNGTRGPAILLKRPKDATVLKFHPNYKHKNSIAAESGLVRKDKSVRVARATRNVKPVVKQREKLVCPVCGILTYTLSNHISTHQEKKKYTCEECPKTFSQKSNLQAHMKQHSGIKDHICELCGAGFFSQKSLVRHNLIHKGERPYPCNLCNKKFIARCDLNRHLRIHSGYKPYKCALCTMSFNAKHQLQNHERMHTGERPYTCQVCNVAFSYKVNLNNHVFKVHGVNLKFKSIHTVTVDVLRQEVENSTSSNETRVALAHLMPHLEPDENVHETIVVSHDHSDYSL